MDFELGTLDKDVVVDVKDENDAVVEQFSLKALINLIIDFINKLIKFEF